VTGAAGCTKRAVRLAVVDALAHAAPMVTGLGPVRATLGRRLADLGDPKQVARTPETVFRLVARDLNGGGTALLHDSDCTSKPRSWRSALGELPPPLDHCAERGWRVGPLRDHGLEQTSGRAAA
jgi:peptidoglycan-N-acetylglucosamine deacetylase